MSHVNTNKNNLLRAYCVLAPLDTLLRPFRPSGRWNAPGYIACSCSHCLLGEPCTQGRLQGLGEWKGSFQLGNQRWFQKALESGWGWAEGFRQRWIKERRQKWQWASNASDTFNQDYKNVILTNWIFKNCIFIQTTFKH